jgi:hypothetical protein
MSFICETCNFKTNVKQNYSRHCQTKKHLKLCESCVEVCDEPVTNDVITLEKMNYELRIRELEISLKCEKEKNELLLSLLNKQVTIMQPILETPTEPVIEIIPEVVPEPIVDEPKSKTKFQLLNLVPETKPEVKPTPEPTPNVSSPRNNAKVKCIKQFLEKKCIVGDNRMDDFLEKIKEKINETNILLVAAKRKDKMEYAWGLIQEVFASYSKHNKPFYSDDKYHKYCYFVNGKEWVKKSVCGEKDNDVVSGGMIYNLLADINGLLLEKAEEMGKIYRFTEDMLDDWFESHDTDESPPRVGSFVKTKEFKNIDLLETTSDMLDHNTFVLTNTDKFLDMIYITKEEMNE